MNPRTAGTVLLPTGGLMLLLGAMCMCSGPIAIAEGEEPGVIVLMLIFAVVYMGIGAADIAAGLHLRNGGRPNVLHYVVALANLSSCCFCGVMSMALTAVTMVGLMMPEDEGF